MASAVPSQFIGGVKPEIAPLAQPGPNAGAILADGVAQGGNTVLQGSEKHAEAQDQLQKLEYQQDTMRQSAAAGLAFAQLRTAMGQTVNDLRADPAPGGAGHVQAVKAAFDPQVDTLMNGITNPDVRQHMLEQIASYGADLSVSESQWQTQKTNEKMVGDAREATDLSANLAGQMTDPRQIAAEISRNSAIYELMPIGADERDKLKRQGIATILGTSIQGATSRGDTGLASNLLGSDAAMQYLHPEVKHVLTRAVGIEQHRQDFAARNAQDQANNKVNGVEDAILGQYNMGTQVDPALLHAAAARATDDPIRAQRFTLAAAGAEEQLVYGGNAANPSQITQRLAEIEATKDWRSNPKLVERHNVDTRIRDQARSAPPNIPDVDFADPNAVQGRIAGYLASVRSGADKSPFLGTDQATRLTQAFNASADGRLQVINALSNLPRQYSQLALNQIAPGDEMAKRLVMLPAATRQMVVDGQAARKGDKTLIDGPNHAGGTPGTASQSITDFRNFIGPAMKLFPPGQQQATQETYRNLYASYLFHHQGTTSYNAAQAYTFTHQALGGTQDAQGTFHGGLGSWQLAGKNMPVLLPDGVSGQDLQRAVPTLTWKPGWSGAPVYQGAAGAPGAEMTPMQVRQGFYPVMQPDYRYQFQGPRGEQLRRRDGSLFTATLTPHGFRP